MLRGISRFCQCGCVSFSTRMLVLVLVLVLVLMMMDAGVMGAMFFGGAVLGARALNFRFNGCSAGLFIFFAMGKHPLHTQARGRCL